MQEKSGAGLIDLLQLVVAPEWMIGNVVCVGRIDQPVSDFEPHRKLVESGEVGRVVRALHHDQQEGISRKHRVTSAFRRGMPVKLGIRSSPGRLVTQFVAQVCADHPALALVAAHNRLPIRKPLGFWIFSVVPKAIAIGLATTPVRSAYMVIEDHHDMGVGQRADDRVHNFHSMSASKLWVCFHRIIGHQRIVLQRLIGPRQAHGVHAQIDNLFHYGGQRSMVEASSNKVLLIEAVPID